jgi:hypothetical protein
LFIVASKSGTTTETLAFYEYFYDKTGGNADQFIAITDPGSELAALAKKVGFRDIFLNPADIGGRYSALSYFGMVPAALLGLDLDHLWDEAESMMQMCSDGVADETNPGLMLGAIIGALGREGRDKLTIHASQRIASFGNWVEQLIAESTGKEGKGIVPIVGKPLGRPAEYNTDRLFVYLKLEDEPDNDKLDAGVRALREAGHPRVTLRLASPYALAGEFFRWEYATAVAGRLLNINPFDEPNVTESKDNTKRLLMHVIEHGHLPKTTPFITGNTMDLYLSESTLKPLRELCQAHGYNSKSRTELLAAQITGTMAGDYFGLQVYLPPLPEVVAMLEQVRHRLRKVTGRAVTMDYGPRFLHSTGQLHKGGPNNGVFFQITADHTTTRAIPNRPYDFGTLIDAQAAGDLEALDAHNRRAIRLHIKGDNILEGISKLLQAVEFVEERRS